MAKSVSCIVDDYPRASLLIGDLKQAGFGDDDISVLMHDSAKGADVMHERINDTPDSATSGAIKGASAGGVLGGVAGLLAGMAALAIPGVGPILAIGPIFTALSGAAVGAAFGGLTGAMVGLGVPEIDARRYETRLASGSVFIAVHTEDAGERQRVLEIFDRAGVSDISQTGEPSVRGALPSRPEPDPVAYAHVPTHPQPRIDP